MAGTTASEQPAVSTRGPWPKGAAVGRVARWLFYSVILALIPILISFAWLPKGTTITMLLSHGDLAVVATALFGVSMGEIFGSEEPSNPKILREALIGACLLLWFGSGLLLSFIAGHAPAFTVGQEVKYSWFLFLAAVVVGIATYAATVSRSRGSDNK